MYYSKLGFYLAAKQSDVKFVLSHDHDLFYKDYEVSMTQLYKTDNILKEPCIQMVSSWMMVKNIPDHTKIRGLVNHAFTKSRVQGLISNIQEIVDDLIDHFKSQKRADLMKAFAFPLPVIITCELLGIPKEDRNDFLENAYVPIKLLDPIPSSRQELDQYNENTQYLKKYFKDLCEQRKKNPKTDLITALVNAEEEEEEEGEKLTDREIFSNILLLFFAGHETTTNLICNGLLALFQNPLQLKLLKENLESMPNAVEELLRYSSSVQMVGPRFAKEDMEIGGVLIKKNHRVLPLLGAANRDPRVYENPNQLNIMREKIDPVSFGMGIHHCLGAHLARLETKIALESLIKRLPNLHLTNIEKPKWRMSFNLRSLESLEALW